MWIPSWASPRPPAASSSLQGRPIAPGTALNTGPTFSLSAEEKLSAAQPPRTPGQAMQALAENENRFRRGPANGSKDFKKIIQQYALPGELDAVTPAENFSNIPTVAVYQIDMMSGGLAIVYHGSDGIVWVNTEGMRGRVKDQPTQGGDLVYQAALTYALHNGLKFIPDPYGVKPIAKARRISQMISSAQRHKTTRHLQVAGINPINEKSYEEVANWREEKSEADFEHNFNQLVLAEMEYVQQEMSHHGQTRLEDLRWDPQDDTVMNVVTGRRLSERDFKSIVSGLDSGNSGVGATTLSRALVARQALQSNGSGKPDLERTESADIQSSGGTVDGSGDKLFTLLQNKKLFYSQPDGSGATLGTTLGSSEQLGQTLAETARFLNQKQPGLVNEHTHLFTTVEALLASDYARQHPFTAEQIASLRTAEGFHDGKTGHSIVIAENTRLLPGENAQQALTRVVLHERVGHAGLQILLGSAESPRARRWAALSAQIPQAELDAIAGEAGYQKLAGDRSALAYEWFARRTEKDASLLEKDSLPRQMWDAFREMVMDVMAHVGLNPTLGRSFETQVNDLKIRARNAALRPVSQAVGSTGPAADTRLQFSQSRTPTAAYQDFRLKQGLNHLSEDLILGIELEQATLDTALNPTQRLQQLTAQRPQATPAQRQALRTLAETYAPGKDSLSLATQARRRLGQEGPAATLADIHSAHARLTPLPLSPQHTPTPRGITQDRQAHHAYLGPMEIQGTWWKGVTSPSVDPATGSPVSTYRHSGDALRPHLDQIVREGHLARTRPGLDGEMEHLLTYPILHEGKPHIAMAVARARADGRLVVEPGMTQIYTPADFQRRLENPALSDTLFELPGKLEDYGPEPQRQALLNMVNRAQTHEEAQGIVHAFQQMKRIGYQLENVSLHYRGNQGLDLIFRTASGELAIVTTPTYAVVEAKHGKGLESLSTDREGLVQGSRGYNRNRLETYLKMGDGAHIDVTKHLINLDNAEELKSFVTLYGSQSIYEMEPMSDGIKFNPILIPQN